MLFDFIYGLIGIILLTLFCLPISFLVPQDAYWFMTPMAVELLEKYGIPRRFSLKDKIIIIALMLIVGGRIYCDDHSCRETGRGFRHESVAIEPSFCNHVLDDIDL